MNMLRLRIFPYSTRLDDYDESYLRGREGPEKPLKGQNLNFVRSYENWYELFRA